MQEKIADSCNDDTCKERVAAILDKVVPFPSGCSKIDGTLKCTKCKNENFRLNDGECDRLRYTPAEAAQWLRDDDNTVILTFRK